MRLEETVELLRGLGIAGLEVKKEPSGTRPEMEQVIIYISQRKRMVLGTSFFPSSSRNLSYDDVSHFSDELDEHFEQHIIALTADEKELIISSLNEAVGVTPTSNK